MDLSKVKTIGDWPKYRRDIEAVVTGVLGKPPNATEDLQVKVVDEQDFPAYTRQRINYFVDDWTRITAWYFVPEGKEERPAIVCCHSKTHRGKDEPAGIDSTRALAFAQHYAERGYVTIAPDSILAGDRISPGLEPYDTKRFYKDFPKSSLLGKMLADYRRCVDLLAEAREVDSGRIGVVGHDLGGLNAILLAAFDERIQTCVSSCAFTAFAEDEDPGRWARDEGMVLAPKLKKAVETREFPFEWEEVLALIAPNPTLLITALNDEILSNTKSVAAAVANARKIYKMLGAENALDNFTHKGGHAMTPEGLQAADEWFERWL